MGNGDVTEHQEISIHLECSHFGYTTAKCTACECDWRLEKLKTIVLVHLRSSRFHRHHQREFLFFSLIFLLLLLEKVKNLA